MAKNGIPLEPRDFRRGKETEPLRDCRIVAKLEFLLSVLTIATVEGGETDEIAYDSVTNRTYVASVGNRSIFCANVDFKVAGVADFKRDKKRNSGGAGFTVQTWTYH